MPPQENFRKNAQGLLSIVLVGGESTIPAISRLELNMAGRVPVGIFRGAEGLIPPDISHLLESKSFWDMVYGHWNAKLLLGSTKMGGASSNTKEIVSLISSLKRARSLSMHLLHPENPHIHESRSVPLSLMFFGMF